MARDSGYIKLHRKCLENEFFLELPFDRWRAFEYLLLSARYKPTRVVLKGQVVDLEAGQLIVGEGTLGEKWGWSRGKVRRYLQQLEKLKMVQLNGTALGTVITVENYTKYQLDGTADDTPDSTSDGTALGTSDGTRIKKVKKVKKGKEEYKSTPTPDISIFSQELQQTITDWLTYKTERNEGYKPKGLEMWIGQVRNYAKLYEEKYIVDVIRRSMASQYKGVVWDWLKDKPSKQTRYKVYREEVRTTDTLTPEEQAENMRLMKDKLGGIFK